LKISNNVSSFLQIRLIRSIYISYRYKVQWYKALLHTQKLILFLLQKGNKNFTLGIGGLFVSSLDCFASVGSIIYRVNIYDNIF